VIFLFFKLCIMVYGSDLQASHLTVSFRWISCFIAFLICMSLYIKGSDKYINVNIIGLSFG